MSDAKRSATPITRRMADAYRETAENPRLREERFGPLLAEARQRLEARRVSWAGSSPPHHTDFAAAFTDGQAFLSASGRILPVGVREVGQLVVTSGRIVACEVFHDNWWRRNPLARTIPAGRYPVLLSATERGIACAMLRVRESPPVRWEMATWPGQDPTKLGVGQSVGYSVDGGSGGFLDADQVRFLDDSFGWKGFDYRLKTLRKDFFAGMWNTETCDGVTGGNLFYFRSGFGDGAYASYWGLGGDGEPACLVTDFQVLTEARDVVMHLPFEFRRPPSDVRHPALDLAGLIMEVIPGGTPKRSLAVGFVGPKASPIEASLLTELGEALTSGTSRDAFDGGGMAFSSLELDVPRGHISAWVELRVRLPLGDYPMQAVGP